MPTLRMLVASGATVPIVLTQPDRPARRGRRLAASAVKAAAVDLGLGVAQPATLRDPDLPERLGARPDLLVVVAYGLLLPRRLLEWPHQGCVNVHASLLPRWRGAAPIQRAILEGDAMTGVSLMQMDAGLDTGPVFRAEATVIGANETAGELHDRLAELGARALAGALAELVAGKLIPTRQRSERATTAGKIAKSDAPLDWRSDAVALARRVRAFNPWPVAEARLSDGRRLRVWRAAAHAGGASAPPGTIVAARGAGIDVATGAGILRLTQVQPPAGRVMAAGAYLAAHPLQGVAFVA